MPKGMLSLKRASAVLINCWLLISISFRWFSLFVSGSGVRGMQTFSWYLSSERTTQGGWLLRFFLQWFCLSQQLDTSHRFLGLGNCFYGWGFASSHSVCFFGTDKFLAPQVSIFQTLILLSWFSDFFPMSGNLFSTSL